MFGTDAKGTAKSALKWYMKKVLNEYKVEPQLQKKVIRCRNSVYEKNQEELEQLFSGISKAVAEGNSKGNVAMNAASLLKTTRSMRQLSKTQLWQQLEVVEPVALRINMVLLLPHALAMLTCCGRS